MYTHLPNAPRNPASVAQIARFRRIYTRQNARLGAAIPEAGKPTFE